VGANSETTGVRTAAARCAENGQPTAIASAPVSSATRASTP